MNKTTNYKQFKFRNDNREKIDPSHLKVLAQSIKTRNLLEHKPIIVNENMEIIDGQHRLLAAEQLGVPIYYVVEKDISLKDLIHLQTQKNWRMADYFSAYSKNGYEEYQKALDFAKQTQLPLHIVVSFAHGRNQDTYRKIKAGDFVFKQTAKIDDQLSMAQDLVETIKFNNPKHQFLNSSRFWRPLLSIIKNPAYNHIKMMKNLNSLIAKVGKRADYEGYLQMLLSIHNYKNQNKIILSADDQNEDDDE